jgi:hypothetical protein
MATTFAVPDGRVAMAATLYTGNGSTNTISNDVNTVSFQPDFVWVKGRNEAFYHRLTSSLQSLPNYLSSNSTDAEGTVNGTISAITSTGFSVNINGGIGGTNSTGINYVGWTWKGGGAGVSNTAGTITSSVSANTTAGFSVVTYTGNGSASATVGHGLGVAPSLIIVKNRSAAGPSWAVYHVSIPTQYIVLNITDAAQAGQWISSTATTISYSSLSTWTGTASATYVAYCWAPVAGYSAFGSYTGNGSADGPFVYTGFRPRFVLYKKYSAAGNDWRIWDSSRNTSNATTLGLYPDTAVAEDTSAGPIDILSNGFKLRTAGAGDNGSGDGFIYAAFAENPLKYSNAR